jgi:signal transduction histidine kinase
MKLLTKNSLNLLSLTLFVFLFGIIAFYILLRFEVDRSINKELDKRELSILDQVTREQSLKNIIPFQDENIIIKPVHKDVIPAAVYYDTLLFDQSAKKFMAFRQHSFMLTFNHQKYHIRIFKSLEETDNLIVRIFLIMTFLVLAMIITLILINRYSSGQIWKDFYDTLKKINHYDINSQEQFILNPSEIKEFEDLNNVMLKMIDRIKLNYFNMKEYAENASHEIQTPLSIINAKMELLLQSGDMKEKHLKSVLEVYEASNRLSRVNTTLLLLAKIENRQFPESAPVDPKAIFDYQLECLEDLILSKKLEINTHYDKQVLIHMNPYLAEVLFSNLIKNAIRHNIPGGSIFIELTNHNFMISNTGAELKFNPEDLFKRFYKSSASSESLGLGLAIVQKICEVYDFKLNYSHINHMHTVTVGF